MNALATITLRLYAPTDEEAAIELWRRTWQIAYPKLDFAGRVDWWRTRWREELVPNNIVTLALAGEEIVGLVTVEPRSGYLDQIVVAPEHWGTDIAARLMNEAKRLSPGGLELAVNTDNARALAFYRKQGFAIAGESVNPRSGAPVYVMRWP